MLGMSVKVEDRTKRVEKATEKAAFKNIGHAAAAISKTAKQSIQVSPDPAPAGQPPHTRRRQLNRAIRYHVDKQKQEAVIGPQASVVGEAGAAHEFGETFHGQDFQERPFMWPALEKNVDRFGSSFKGSIGE